MQAVKPWDGHGALKLSSSFPKSHRLLSKAVKSMAIRAGLLCCSQKCASVLQSGVFCAPICWHCPRIPKIYITWKTGRTWRVGFTLRLTFLNARKSLENAIMLSSSACCHPIVLNTTGTTLRGSYSISGQVYIFCPVDIFVAVL